MTISKEVKIGATAILALIIIYVGIIFLKGLKLFSNDVSYYVEMKDVQGMPVAADVMANGMKVGSVKSITFNNESQKMLVEISVSPSFHIPHGSSAFLTKEMLGSPKLNIKLGSNPANFLQPGATLQGEGGADLMGMATEMIPQVQALLPKVDSILDALNTLTHNPALDASLHNLEQVTEDLKTTTRNVNTLLGNDIPTLMSKANNICTNLETTTNNFNQIDMVGLASTAGQTLDNVQNMTFKINTALNSKDNSLGLLMNDNAVALHLDSTMLNASRLLEEVRLHPKRFVHFSLFGKKDK